jgi:organic hydroperoxide reductase OsmC/OhrA
MSRTHNYDISVSWTGNRGVGTSELRAYGRDHDVIAVGRPVIAASSDPEYRGDSSRWNPELEFVTALSQRHMLWYLHLCADEGINVISYSDDAHGTMTQASNGSGHFTEVVLRPKVTVRSSAMIEAAMRLHQEAHAKCFIANSVNFPVRYEPAVTVADNLP